MEWFGGIILKSTHIRDPVKTAQKCLGWGLYVHVYATDQIPKRNLKPPPLRVRKNSAQNFSFYPLTFSQLGLGG